MNQKTKNILIATIAAIILIAAISYYFYLQGKKGITIQYNPGELPGDPGSGTQYGASNNDIKSLAQSLYDDMKGLNYFGHDMAPYQKALTYGDGDLIKLYNTFNSNYQKESGQTLAAWIDSEKYYNNEVTDTLLNRFAKLNLI
jgi:hypothetical protein